MLRTVYWIIDFLLYAAYIRILIIKGRRLNQQGKVSERRDFTQKKGAAWSNRLLKNTGSSIVVEGREHIPPDGPVLIVSNHQSYFDIPLMVSLIPLPMGFVAKKELKKIPVIKHWMDLIECSYIDRKDIRQSLKAIQKAQKSLESGQSMVIFPEGTRSKKREISAFKPGSLKLAQKAGVPILPVAIDGSWQIFEASNRIKPSTVHVKIMPLISAEEVSAASTNDLMSRVFSDIRKELGMSGLLTP